MLNLPAAIHWTKPDYSQWISVHREGVSRSGPMLDCYRTVVNTRFQLWLLVALITLDGGHVESVKEIEQETPHE